MEIIITIFINHNNIINHIDSNIISKNKIILTINNK